VAYVVRKDKLREDNAQLEPGENAGPEEIVQPPERSLYLPYVTGQVTPGDDAPAVMDMPDEVEGQAAPSSGPAPRWVLRRLLVPVNQPLILPG
jgi:hypothetical protein